MDGDGRYPHPWISHSVIGYCNDVTWCDVSGDDRERFGSWVWRSAIGKSHDVTWCDVSEGDGPVKIDGTNLQTVIMRTDVKSGEGDDNGSPTFCPHIS